MRHSPHCKETNNMSVFKVRFVILLKVLPSQDFIWLHDVIQENLQYAGFIIPPKVCISLEFLNPWQNVWF